MENLFLGKNPINRQQEKISGSFIELDGQKWYRISNYDQMPSFFMSITSPEDFWMFISSTGGLTCGRQDKDNALFPYDNDDKVSSSAHDTGSLTSIILTEDKGSYLWNPLDSSEEQGYQIKRTLYKTVTGDRILFEEENRSLELIYRMSWETSPAYGIHRRSSLINTSSRKRKIRLLDGMRNILPAGITAQTQGAFSNLLNAYKRSECDRETGLGIFALSATLTDQAEPSESLKATTVWSYGLDDTALLLSENQLRDFRKGDIPEPEEDIKGERGAYLRTGEVELAPAGTLGWGMVAELKQDHSRIIKLIDSLSRDKKSLVQNLQKDLDASSERLKQIIAINDGEQDTGSEESVAHHGANVLFNIMRGGYFIDGYRIKTSQFRDFAVSWNKDSAKRMDTILEDFPEELSLPELQEMIARTGDTDLRRYSYEYLPLTFGRRHGDPSRPWNQFFIQTRDEQGKQKIGYQGNWRDIFQNWEALCFSYPAYYPSMIAKFLNATTADGYNPYKISQEGIDWEIPNPDDPWANIGYWSDHQIIYLLKMLEHSNDFQPGLLSSLLNEPVFAYAHVPYKIRPLEQIMEDPYNSIEFDDETHRQLMERSNRIGADGKLLTRGDTIVYATMAEKLLVLFLAKLSNYVPGGGIWMNTQRPEWNDANNALAGWGLSMVTLSYLVRYLDFLEKLVPQKGNITLHGQTAEWLKQSLQALSDAAGDIESNPAGRFEMIRALGTAASDYRTSLYSKGLTEWTESLDASVVLELITLSRNQFLKTLDYCRRDDGSFESYQVLSLKEGKAEIKKLYPMLEGQVAGMSLNHYDADSTIQVLDVLQKSLLYRKDQHSYMLYPNRDIPGFLSKNTLSHDQVLQAAKGRDPQVLFSRQLHRDVRGNWHFDGTYRNVKDLEEASGELSEADRKALSELFESTFHHSEFTGRSGTFFAYEGLGSIYWHMVSKLMLAVQERLIDAVEAGEQEEKVSLLKEKYLDIRRGIGFNKPPEVYGAFPCDPYSHSPWNKGAKQPGMTGQVKEEVLARFAELGLIIRKGCVEFQPVLILEDQWKDDGSYSFSYCGIPIEVSKSDRNQIGLIKADGSEIRMEGLTISADWSRKIFDRSGEISGLRVSVKL